MASIYNYLHYVPEVNSNNINDPEFMKDHDAYVEYLRNAQDYFDYYDSVKNNMSLEDVQKLYSALLKPEYEDRLPELYKNKIAEIDKHFFRLRDEHLAKRDSVNSQQEQNNTQTFDNERVKLDQMRLDYNRLLSELEKYSFIPQVAKQIQNVKNKNQELDSISILTKDDYDKVVQGKKEIIDYLNKANGFIQSNINKQKTQSQQKLTETRVFYHGGAEPDFSIDKLDVLKSSEKQQKTNSNYAGFYMYSEEDYDDAVKYAIQENSIKGTNTKGIVKIYNY